MASRDQRAATAAETLQILAKGSYAGRGAMAVSIEPALGASIAGTRLYGPQALAGLGSTPPPQRQNTTVSVVNCTTLAGARALAAARPGSRVCVLNFASARNPGGGFLEGSQAQEESLARSSGLYASLVTMQAFYDANRRERSALYTDHMIHSPEVPVFRDDDDRLLDAPWTVSMITAPAVNAGAVRSNEPRRAAEIPTVMRRRIGYVLAVAAHHRHDALVLGAWGCGVFANDPAEVAALFAEQLLASGRYAGAFAAVTFAVLDRSGETLRAFDEVFGRGPRPAVPG